MLKKTMTYTDFDGNSRTEDFYFNLSKAELMELEMGTSGGLSQLINKISAEKDTAKIVELFKKILLMSYGEKSPDGKRFIKSAELTEAFTQTAAYSDLFMQLATEDGKAAEFMNAIIPEIPAPEKKAITSDK